MEKQYILKDQELMNKLLETCMTYLKQLESQPSSSIVQGLENWIKDNSGQVLSRLKMDIWPTVDTGTGANGFRLQACLFLQILTPTGILSARIDGTNSSLKTEKWPSITKEKNG